MKKLIIISEEDLEYLKIHQANELTFEFIDKIMDAIIKGYSLLKYDEEDK